MRPLLTALLAFGVFAATVLSGLALVRVSAANAPAMRRVAAWGLAVPVGVALWSPVLVFAAYAGSFGPEWLGTCGWIAAAACLVHLHGERSAWQSVFTPVRVAAWVAMVPVAWLYTMFPNESLLGARDEGLHSLAALLLQRTGGLLLDVPEAVNAAPSMFKPYVNGQPFFLPGVYATANGAQLQFAPLLPAWIAQFTAATGGHGAFRFSALVALGSIVVFYLLASRMVRRSLALLATVMFALEPAQVWIARNSLVEPLAQLLVLGGLLAAAYGVRIRKIGLARVAGTLFGVAAYCRLDLIVLTPLTIGATTAAHIWLRERSGGAIGVLESLALATGTGQGLAIALLWWRHPIYLGDNLQPVCLAAAAAAAASIALFASRRGRLQLLASPAARVSLATIAAAVLAMLFVYSVWIRPDREPFALIARLGSALDGTRDYREASMHNLAAYLGWPAVVLAFVGSGVAMSRLFRGRSSPVTALVGVVVVATSIVVLANPRISPDHFWSIRRFVPLVIPGVLLLAAYGVQALLLRLGCMRQRWLVWGVAVVAGLTLLAQQRQTLFMRENRDLPAQLASLDGLLRDAPVVIVRELDALATTLFVGYGRPVLPLRDGATPVDDQARAFWKRCSTAAPCAMLHSDFSGLTGLALGATQRVAITREFIAPTIVPLPRAMARETTEVLITPVFGMARDSAPALVGAYRNWHRDDAGLYREEIGDAWSSRWTNGDASLLLPSLPADTLEIIVGPGGRGPGRVVVALDGEVLFEGPQAPGVQRLMFALPHAAPGAIARRLSIVSSTFVPKLEQRGLDDRRLGVSLLAVRQLDSRAPRLGAIAGAEAYRANLEVIGAPFTTPVVVGPGLPARRVTLSLSNVSNATWPSQGDTRAGEAPVAIGILWLRPGEVAPMLEQRVHLPFSLQPGERLLLAPGLVPTREDGSMLPAGVYEVSIGLVHEGVAWITRRGDILKRLPVTVVSATPHP